MPQTETMNGDEGVVVSLQDLVTGKKTPVKEVPIGTEIRKPDGSMWVIQGHNADGSINMESK
jgi:hypothetical protein